MEQNDLTSRWRTMQLLTLFRSWIWLLIDLRNSLEWWSTGHSTRRLKDTVLNPSDHKFNVRHTAVPIPEPFFCLSVWCSAHFGLQTFFANSRTISERRAQGSLEKYSQRSSLSYDVFYNYTITLCDTRRRLVHFSSSSGIFNLSPRSLQDETTDSSDYKLRRDWLFRHFWKCSQVVCRSCSHLSHACVQETNPFACLQPLAQISWTTLKSRASAWSNLRQRH